MRIGFIGAGRAGTSVAKYFSAARNTTIVGFFSERLSDAAESAEFTSSAAYKTAETLLADSDVIFITTGDHAISGVWKTLDKDVLTGKIIAHLSGSLGSDVFSGAKDYGTVVGSLHPAYAFDNKFTSYKNLGGAVFTAEGDEKFLEAVGAIIKSLGNRLIIIASENKKLYHAAASLASNHLLGLLNICIGILGQCGFSEDDARTLLRPLMTGNLINALEGGTEQALTGPIERGDTATVRAHLNALDTADQKVYNALGKSVLELARRKHSDDTQLCEKYSEIERMLNNEKYGSNISAE